MLEQWQILPPPEAFLAMYFKYKRRRRDDGPSGPFKLPSMGRLKDHERADMRARSGVVRVR